MLLILAFLLVAVEGALRPSLWTSFPIRYDVEDGLDSEMIESALQEWSTRTCVDFQKREKNEAVDVSFVRSPSSCYAHIGRLLQKRGSNERQLVALHESCASRGVLLHEIGHALGLHHTHTRSDRNDYVVVRPENVRSPSLLPDFHRRLRRSATDSVPYDLGSIMHYAITTFARSPSTFPLLPRDTLYAQTIGQRKGLAFYDVKALNEVYCHDSCSSSSTTCLHGGYPNPRSCNECICPAGFSGTHCEDLANDAACPIDTRRIARTSWEDINFTADSEMKCTWQIEAPLGYVIEFLLQSVETSTPSGAICSGDEVELKFRRDLGLTGARFCHFGMGNSRRSDTRRMLVLLRKSSFAAEPAHFILHYRAVPSREL